MLSGFLFPGRESYQPALTQSIRKGLTSTSESSINVWKTEFSPGSPCSIADLPQDLENRGGWKNRDIVDWFSEYAGVCTKAFGDRIKDWMVLNEPFAFTGLGYLLGMHAPGKYGVKNFIPAMHHANLCQAEGGRIIRENVTNARVGTTQTITLVDPFENTEDDLNVVKRYDALLNRLFIEPSLGFGYPVTDLPMLSPG
jgi:beta-glucosidase